MSQFEPINYVDLDSGEIREEAVYGGFWVRALYGTRIGRVLSYLIAAPSVSRFYGRLQDRPSSRRKIEPFITQFGIDMNDFLPEEGRPKESPYSNFNAFFTRRLAPGARPFADGPFFPAPCDARYYGFDRLDENMSVPVKGADLTARSLIRNDDWYRFFENGPGFVARLCPVDYHRFHFPDDGEIAESWRIPGALHSVNPWALAARPETFLLNERQVTILRAERFGRLAFVEVGATFVGRIEQIHPGGPFRRGDEKGMFLFGGSSVIVVGERGRWVIDPVILENTSKGFETYVRAGRALGCET